MKYVRLGRTGVFVSQIGLGSMTFGEGNIRKLGGVPMDLAMKMVKRAHDAGVNLFDTADVYEGGRSEEIVGEAVKGIRSEVILATKVRGRTGPGVNDQGLSRYHMLRAVRESIRRLGTDYIDLYQLHGWDSATPLEETMDAMEHLISEGLVIYPGVSNFTAWQMAYLMGMVKARGYHEYVSAQMNYSLLNRDIEHEVLPFMKHAGMTLIVWSPLQGGVLSGKYTDLENPPKGTRLGDTGRRFPYFLEEQYPAIMETLTDVARQAGATPAQVAISWLLSKGSVVLIGARTMEQLEENLGALDVRLSPDQVKRLDEATGQRKMYPNWMVERQNADRYPQGYAEY